MGPECVNSHSLERRWRFSAVRLPQIGPKRPLHERTVGANHRPTASLIKAIARAYDWYQRLLSGTAKNQREIAQQEGLDERYVSRLLPYAFLAPEIVTMILEGKQPEYEFFGKGSGGDVHWSTRLHLSRCTPTHLCKKV
jgi:hypothetical protein